MNILTLSADSALPFYERLTRYDPPGAKRTTVGIPQKGPVDHTWGAAGDPARLAAAVGGRGSRYVAMGCYSGEADLTRYKGRTRDNVCWLPGFWIDIDVQHSGKHKAGSYATAEEAQAAAKGIIQKFHPTDLVKPGSGGFHFHWFIKGGLTVAQWAPRAAALVSALQAAGFVVDAPCTTDPARVMRAPGSTRVFDGQTVTVKHHVIHKEFLTVQEFDELFGFDASAPVDSKDSLLGAGAGAGKYDPSVNGDIEPGYDSTPGDFGQICAHDGCQTFEIAVADPAEVPGKLWFPLVQVVRHCSDPEGALDAISQGHPRYDAVKDRRRMHSLNEGPAKCATIRGAGGKGCDTCKHARQSAEGGWLPPAFGTPLMLGRRAVVPNADAVGAAGGDTDLRALLPDWQIRQSQGEDGQWRKVRVKPLNTSNNVAALAQHFGWAVRYSAMTKRTEMTRDGVVVLGDDAENTALTLFGDDCVRAGLARDGLAALVDAVAVTRTYHPALEWIRSTPWDGKDRLGQFYGTLTMANPEKAPLAARLIEKWMLQGIGALVEPDGITASGLLVLAGPQYAGKSYWIKHLVDTRLGAVGTGLGLDPHDKDSILRAIRCFIGELAELDGTFRRADIAALKGFLTDGADVVRLPYARRDTTFPRRSIYAASVNDTAFLVDDTGNRRFYTLEIKSCTVLPAHDMQQVWAQFFVKYQQGERWTLDRGLLAELNESNRDHEQVDPLRERISTRWDWASVDWNAAVTARWDAMPSVVWKTASEVCAAVGIDRPTKPEATRVGVIVKGLRQGIDLARKSNGARLLAVPARAGTHSAASVRAV